MPNERTAFSNLVRKHLAFQGLAADPTLKLTAEQLKEIKDSLKRLEGDLSEGVRRLYRQLYLPARTGWKEIDLGLPTVGDVKPLDQEVYDRLRMDSEILERIAPLVIKEKYLKERDWVSTSQLYQASLKTPGETRALNQSGWEVGIAEGVHKGLFGLGELKDNQPVCRYYKEEPSISFTDSEILLKAEVCEAQRAAQEGQVTFTPGVTATGPSAGETAPAQTFGQSTFVPTTPTAGKYQQLHFNFVVPKGKVSSLMGVLNYLQSRYNRLEISLNVGEGQLTEQEYEDKVKEAFRQMGIEIE
jgi:hypothetical protein